MFAIVFRAIHKKSGAICAVKCIDVAALNTRMVERIDFEVEIMRKLSGAPNVARSD